MKTKPALSFVQTSIILAIVAVSFSLHAADRWWDGTSNTGAGNGISDGGTGTWDVATTNWDNGTDHVAWVNANNDAANFGAAGGTVTLGAAITANALTLNGGTYIITANTLTLAGTAPSITNSANVTISSTLAGASGLIKAGAGTLTVTKTSPNNAAAYLSGGSVITNGTLKIDCTGWSVASSAGYSMGTMSVGSTLELFYPTAGNVDLIFFGNSGNVINGAGTLNKTGAGYIDLGGGGAGTPSIKFFTGQINVQAGCLGVNATDWASSLGQMSVDVSAGAYFDVRVGDVMIDKLTGAGSVGATYNALPGANRNLIVGNNNSSFTFSGSISNSITWPGYTAGGIINVTKNGAGVFTLTGTNAFTGPITNNAGAITLDGAGLLGAGSYAGAFVNNANFTNNSSAAQTLSGAISGSGPIIKSGAGNMTLSGASPSYAGTIALNSGKLFVNGSVGPSTTWTMASGTTLGGSGGIASSVTVSNNAAIETGSGAGVGVLSVGTLVLGDQPTDASSIVISNLSTTARLVVTNLTVNSGAGLVAIKVFGPFALGQFPLISNPGGSLSGSFSAFALVLPSPNVVASLVNNTASNTVDLLVTSAGTIVWSGTNSTEWSTNILTPNKNWARGTIAGTPTDFYPGDAVTFDDTLTGSSTVDISVASVRPGSVFFNNSATNYTVTGTSGLSGATAVTKIGSGTVTVQNASNALGAITVGNGTLTLAAAGANTLGAVVVSNAATLVVDSTNSPASTTIGTGGTVRIGNSDANGSLSGPITDNGALIFNRTDAALNFSGAISGTGTVTKTGSGTVTNSAASTYSGATLVNQGVYVLAAGNALANSPITVASGAELDLNGIDPLGSGVTLPLYVSGTVRKVGTQSESLGRPIFMSNGTLSSVALANESWNLFNSYIQTLPNTTNSILGAGNFAVRTPGTYFNVAANSLLSIDTTVSLYSGGTAPLAKFGPGTLRLTATNTYSTSTFIGGGTLVLGPSALITNTPLIYLAPGAAFDVSAAPFVLGQAKAQNLVGYGTVNGPLATTNANASITPGTNGIAGTLALNGNVTLTNTTLNFDLANNSPAIVGGGVNDLIQMDGSSTLTLLGTNPVALNFLGGLSNGIPGGTYTLLQGAGSIVGSGANFSASSVAGLSVRPGALTFSTTPSSVTLAVTPAPLVWRGTNTYNWDLATTNWDKTGSPDRFFNLDAVTFDDSTPSNQVNITALVTPASLTVNAAQNYTFYGAGSLSNAFPMLKTNTGTLTILSNNAGYSGPITVAQGTLQVGGGTNLGTVGTGPIAVGTSGTLRFYRSDSFTVANLLGGNGALSLKGPGGTALGSFSLSANNAFTGAISLDLARLLDSTGPANYGSFSQVNIAAGSQISAQNAGVYNVPLNLAGIGWTESLGNFGALRLNNSGAIWTGPITLSANARIGVCNNGALTPTLLAPISGPYELEFYGTNASTSTLTLGSPTNATSATRINGQLVVVVNNANALSTGPLTLTNNAAGITPTLRLNGFNMSFASLSGPVGTINNLNATAPATLTVGSDGTSTLYGGGTADGSSARLYFTKVGGGRLTLTNANLFHSGDTTISAGTLALSNGPSAMSSLNINIAPGATFDVSGLAAGAFSLIANQNLSGSGSVTGVVKTASGGLNPGGTLAAGTLTFNSDLILSNATTCYFDLTNNSTVGGGVNDLVVVNGNLTASNATIVIRSTSGLAVGTNRLFTYTGTKTASFNPTVVFQTRASGYLDESTLGQINLIVTNASASTALTWAGISGNNNWDINTSAIWNPGAQKFFNGDNVTLDDTATFFVASIPSGTTNYPASITVNTATNYTITAPGTGKIAGPTGITKNGTGTLTLSAPNSFSGNVTINNGVLKPNNTLAFGDYNGGTLINNGATLDLNGLDLRGGERFTVSGTGYTNGGAIINSFTTQGSLRYLTLGADALMAINSQTINVSGIGGAGAYDGVLNLAGNTLTKSGTVSLNIQDCLVTNAGSLQIGAGVVQIMRSWVTGAGLVSVGTNCTLSIVGTSPQYGSITKPLVFGTNATLQLTANNYALAAPITNNSVNLNLDVVSGFTLTLSNNIAGSGSLTKITAGTAQLLAACTYAGNTFVNAGTLSLGPSGSIANSPYLYVASGATFNATGVPNYALPTGQTLAGAGTVSGLFSVGAGTTIQPGGQTVAGTLTLNGASTLTLSGTTVELELSPNYSSGNDVLAVAGNLTLSGTSTLKLHALGALDTARPYTVITYTGNLTGTAANFAVVTDSRYSFTVDTTVPGQVRVWATGTPASVVWKGNNGTNPSFWDTVTPNWLNGVAADTFHTGDSVSFDDTASTYTVNVQSPLTLGTMTFNANTDYTLGGVAASPYAQSLLGSTLTKGGNGKLILARTNNFSSVIFNGGTLQLGTGGTDGWVNNLPTTLGGTLVFNRADNVATSTGFAGGGSLLKSGVGMLTLSGASTYTGATTISQGTLTLNNAAPLSQASSIIIGDASSGVTIPTLNLIPQQTLGTLTIGSGVTGATLLMSPTANNFYTFTNVVTLNSPLIIAKANNASFYGVFQQNQKITGSGAAAGTDALVFTNLGGTAYWQINTPTANDFTGDVHIKGGTWNVQGNTGNLANNVGIPDASALIIDSGAMLQLNNAALTQPWTESFDRLVGGGTFFANSITTTFTIGGANGSGLFTGGLTSVLGIVKVGNGTQVFSGPGITYSGATTINNGVLRLVEATNFASAVSISAGTLEMSNTVAWTYNQVLSGSGAFVKTGPGTLTLNGAHSAFTGSISANAGTLTFTNVFGIPSALGVAAGSTLNIGAGSLNPNFTGTATVNGTLNVAGDLGSSVFSIPTLTVNSGGNLIGGGMVGGLVTVNDGGTLSALSGTNFNFVGTSFGQGLTLGVTATDHTYSTFNSDGSSVTCVATVPGTLTLNGTNTVTMTGVPPVVGTYPLIAYTNVTGSAQFILTTLGPSAQGYVTNNLADAAIELVITNSDSLVWKGSPNNNWSLSTGPSGKVWHTASNPGTSVAFANGSVVKFDDTAANFAVNVTASVVPSAITVNAAANYLYQGLPIQFGGTLIKEGGGTLTLSNQVTAGGLELDGGTLVAADTETFTNLTFDGGTLQSGGGGAAGWFNLPATVNMTSASNACAVVFNRADTVTNSSLITGTGSFTQMGPGILTMTAAASYTGDTTIAAGTLKQGGVANVIPYGAGKGNVTLNGTLDLNMFSAIVNGLSGSGKVDTVAGGTPVLTVGSNDVSSVFAGTLTNSSGSLSLVKLGTGELDLTGTNSMVGAVVGGNGTLVFNGGVWNASAGQAATRNLAVGNGATGPGMVIITNNASITLAGWADAGYQNGGTGTLVLENGTLTINGISGGTPGDRGLVIGEYASSTGVFNQNNGVLNVSNTVWLGQLGAGTWNLNGGSANIGKLSFGSGTGSAGTLNLDGGILKIGAGGITLGSGSSTINLNGGMLGALAAWSSPRPITLGSPGPAMDTTGGNITLSGGLSGLGGLVKNGTNTLTLSGTAPIYGGPTVINGGTLSLPLGYGNSGAITVNANATLSGQGSVSGAVTVNNGSALTASGSSAFTLSAGLTLGAAATDLQTLNVSGIGLDTGGYLDSGTSPGLAVNGTNMVNVSGLASTAVPSTNTVLFHHGAITGAGVFVLGNTGRAQGYLLDTGTELDFVVTNIPPVLWVGSPANNWDLTGTNVWRLPDNTPVGFANGDYTFFDNTASNFVVNLTTTVSPAAVTVSSSSNYLFGGTGAIGGSASLAKSGSGTLTLTNANMYAGGTTVSNGTLQIGNGGTTGSVAGAITVTNTGSLTYYRGDAALVTVANTLSGNGVVNLNGTGGNQISQYALSGSNSAFTGVLNVGLARVESANAANNFGSGSIVVNSGGSIAAAFTGTAGTTFTQPLSIAGIGWLEAAGNLGALRMQNSDIWAGPITLTANARIGVWAGASGTVSGPLSGAYELELFGGNSASTLLMSSAANTTAATRINGGAGNQLTATAGSATAFSPGPLTMTNNGNLRLNGFSFAVAELNGTSGTIGNGSAGTASTLTVGTDDASTTYGGSFSSTFGVAAFHLTKVGAGTITLMNTNTFTGDLTINGGSVAAGVIHSLGGESAVRNIIVNSNALLEMNVGNVFGAHNATPALTLVVNSNSAARVNAASNVGLKNVTLNDGTLTSTNGSASVVGTGTYPNRTYGAWDLNGTVTSTGNSFITTIAAANGNCMLSSALTNTSFSVLNGTLTVQVPLVDGDFNAGAGRSGLNKDGAGTLLLNAASIYTGLTSVSNGTLRVNGSIAGSAYVAPAGTLGGSGTIGGSVTNDGTLSPGASIGTLVVNGTVTLNGGGTTVMEINRSASPSNDVLSATSIAFGGTLTVVNTGGTLQAGDTFQLFAGAFSGDFAVTNLPALGTGLNWNWNPATGMLSVQSAVSTTPPHLTNSVSGGSLFLSWPADHLGWRLETQTNSRSIGLSNNWVTVPGSASVTSTNFPITPVTPTVFFRLVYP
jgi:autotransporter-associated beta strand protein